MLTSEILTAARALIDTPEKWCNTSPTGRLGEKQCAGRAIETVAALQGPLRRGECIHSRNRHTKHREMERRA